MGIPCLRRWYDSMAELCPRCGAQPPSNPRQPGGCHGMVHREARHTVRAIRRKDGSNKASSKALGDAEC